MKQKVKIKFNNNEIYFFDHDFKSALHHANQFYKRNKKLYNMQVYLLNENSAGERWLFLKKSTETM